MSARITKAGGADAEYQTPPNFMEAVKHHFGPIGWDLAASAVSTKAASFYSVEQDSLVRNWETEVLIGANEYAWLNPPYTHIKPWACKCDTIGRRLGAGTLLLVPASVGSVWHRRHVFGRSNVYYLEGRIVFVKDPYPKDCMLVHYNVDSLISPQIHIWNWQDEVAMGGKGCLNTYPSGSWPLLHRPGVS